MILALACIIPVVFIFMISISSEHSIKMNGYQFIPSAYSLDSYKFLLREGQMIVTALGVSVAVTVIGTVIGVALTMLMGYVLFQKHLQTERILHHGRFYSNDLQWWYDFFLCS